MTDTVFNLRVKIVADDDWGRKQDKKQIEQLTFELFVDNYGNRDRSSELMRKMQTHEYLTNPVDPENIVVYNWGMIDREIFELKIAGAEFSTEIGDEKRQMLSNFYCLISYADPLHER